MHSMDILKEEHKYIKMVLGGIRKECTGIVNGKPVNYDLFMNIIDFVRNYADKYHHKKEEDQLFNVMSDELGNAVKNGPIMGMLVEHDTGRAHIYDLEMALNSYKSGNTDARVDIIASAIGYEQMLLKHIDKEDNAIYTFAEKNLPPDILSRLDKDFTELEKNQDNTILRDKYIGFAQSLQGRSAVH